ncbi:MAG: peptidylprolyl isomerase [Armatimonadota bacterium]|nr:MAG: peptidylprolyl isomerase [Armatimonadota bacterium]
MKFLTGLFVLVCLAAMLPDAYGQAAVVVNGQSVPLDHYYRRIEQSPVEPVTAFITPVAKQAGLAVLNNLIKETMLLQLAEKEGVSPTEQQISERFAALEEILKQQLVDLKTLLSGAGVSEAEFRESLKPEIAQTNIFSKYIIIPEVSIKTAYRNYTTDLPEDQRRLSPYYLPEAVFLQAVIAETREKAEEARQRLLNGTPFPEVVKQYSVDPRSRERGGDVGWLSRPDTVRTAIPGIPPEIYQKAFATKTDEISEPFESGGRWVLLKVRESKEARFLPFETAKPMMRDRLLIISAAADPQIRALLERARSEATVEVKIPAYRGQVEITIPVVSSRLAGF